MGRSEELGTGLRNVFKYSKAYSGSDHIIVKEEDVFVVEVPLDQTNINDDTTNVLENVLENMLENVLENELTQYEKQILQIILKRPRVTQHELSIEIGIAPQNIRKYISKLKLKNILQRIGPDKGGHWEVTDRK